MRQDIRSGDCRKGADMKVIGITGGVGAGKSALLQYMKEHYSCRIRMADTAAHEVSAKGNRAYPALVKLLESGEYQTGQPVLRADGEIDRAEMASRIFAHPQLREEVNAIVHPAVRDLITSEIEQERYLESQKDENAVRYYILEAALLIECGYGAVVDEMWYIYCDPAVRGKRLQEERGYSAEKVRGIMAAQLTEEQFRAGSDVVIDNSGALADTFRQIDREFARLARST